MKLLLVQYGYLQVLDLLTTLAFLKGGVEEGNPLIASLLNTAASPATVLIAVKAFAILLGVYCWRIQRRTALVKAIVFYALLVAWNLVCLFIGLGTTLMRVGVYAR